MTPEEQLREALEALAALFEEASELGEHRFTFKTIALVRRVLRPHADAALSGKREGTATDSQQGFSPPASDSGPGPDHRDGPATNREQSAASAAREADVRTLLGPTSEGGSGRVSAGCDCATIVEAWWRAKGRLLQNTHEPNLGSARIGAEEVDELLRKLRAMTTTPAAEVGAEARGAGEVDRLRGLLMSARKYARAPRDHACRDCVPHSDMLIDGFRCWFHAPLDAPAAPEARDGARCSLCGSTRIREDYGELGACSLIGCKDPLADYRCEHPDE